VDLVFAPTVFTVERFGFSKLFAAIYVASPVARGRKDLNLQSSVHPNHEPGRSAVASDDEDLYHIFLLLANNQLE
jgi:hypothetical protein